MRPPPARLLAVLACLTILSERTTIASAFVPKALKSASPDRCSMQHLGTVDGPSGGPRRPIKKRTLRRCPPLSAEAGSADDSSNDGHISPQSSSEPLVSSEPGLSRRSILGALPLLAAAAASSRPKPADAAPPMAVIAEELGYFPVTNRNGDTVYVPGRVKRTSTDQSVELARFLESTGAKMYGAYWCPHCSRQREMFGREGWSYITYVECSPKGYGSNLRQCAREDVDGYPTWKFGNGKTGSGEMTLDRIADLSGFKGTFDITLEEPLPAGGGSCR